MPAQYQEFQTEMPCGHVWVGQGPKRGPASTRVPRLPEVRVECFCGWKGYVRVLPVLMVIGYEGQVVPE